MKKTYMIIAVLLAVISFIVAAVYFSETASSLPHFFPGYSATLHAKHTKHGLAFIGLGIVLLIVAWMMSGPKKGNTTADVHNDTEA